MSRSKRVYAADCETPPFKHGRVPRPFIWGLTDGKKFWTFNSTKEFVDAVKELDIIIYAHNGGKFDWIFLLEYLQETRAQIINGRYAKIKIGKAELRDSYSIVPVAMKNIQKRDIEYWKMDEAHRDQHIEEITEYLEYDCRYLWELVTQYRKIAGTKLTIASNALAFSKKLGIDPGKTNSRFDAKMRRFYFGGRTQCWQEGTHRNIKIVDIVSSYPDAMMNEHATGNEFHWQDNFDGLTEEQIKRSFIVLECNSKGAFPLRSKEWGGGLMFPHGYAEYSVTGWEYVVAKKHNLISDEKIISVGYSDKTITFKEYIKHWFDLKLNNPKDKYIVIYTIAKIMMNSLYGKLAQNPENYFDYRIVPAGTEICDFEASRENDRICALCGEKDNNHGWGLHLEYTDHEIHRRESLWKYKFEYGEEWRGKNIFNNVATGASITGFARAHLLDAIHTIGEEHIIYCDTDSLVCDSTADITRLPLSDKIGDWDFEGEGEIGHFAGKKMYGIRMKELDKKTGKPKYKIASKGSRLHEKEITKIINGIETTLTETDYEQAIETMEKLTKGAVIEWKNPAPTFRIDGKANFIVRSIRSTAKATPILERQTQ